MQLESPSQCSTPLAKKNHGALRQEIGETQWVYVVGIKTNGPDLDVSQHRRLNVFAKLRRDRGRFRFLRNDEWLTHSGLRHSFDEITVYCRADAECEDVALIEVLANVIKHSLLPGNVAVCHKHNAAGNACLA